MSDDYQRMRYRMGRRGAPGLFDAYAGMFPDYVYRPQRTPQGEPEPGQAPYLPLVVKPNPMPWHTPPGSYFTPPTPRIQAPYAPGLGYGVNLGYMGDAGSVGAYEDYGNRVMLGPTYPISDPALTGGTMPNAPGAPQQTQAPAGGGGGTTQQQGPQRRQAPLGINQNWYNDFQDEHAGQTPEQFYAATGEGLSEAMADLEWSQGFAQMNGRPPNEYEWENWWHWSRHGGRPGEWKADREKAKKRYKKQQSRARREALEQSAPASPTPTTQTQRPPLWVPPQVIWRND